MNTTLLGLGADILGVIIDALVDDVRDALIMHKMSDFESAMRDIANAAQTCKALARIVASARIMQQHVRAAMHLIDPGSRITYMLRRSLDVSTSPTIVMYQTYVKWQHIEILLRYRAIAYLSFDSNDQKKPMSIVIIGEFTVTSTNGVLKLTLGAVDRIRAVRLREGTRVMCPEYGEHVVSYEFYQNDIRSGNVHIAYDE